MNDFAVFILTHGRPDKVITYEHLERCGYTGRVFIVIDNEDDSKDRYVENFGDQVVIFDKKKIAQTFDNADNFDNRKAIVYARNYCFELAKELGLKYFMQLDDDYSTFSFKFDQNLEFGEKRIFSLDDVLAAMLKFYSRIPALSIAFAQGGDFIGGALGSFGKNPKLRRKCMNTFICSTDRPFQFLGRVNEDVNTYTRTGGVGGIFFTVPLLTITQATTQSNSGGMTELYLESGTYVKSFYTVMFRPDCVKVGMMGHTARRLHHKITWKYAVPKILSEEYRKE